MREDFTQVVLRHFDTRILPEDFGKVQAGIEGLHRDGFSTKDAISYVACWEEIDPFLEEEVALDRMLRIRSKYKGKTNV